jgi:HCOMODA/2-hydroxy-3-carboxy-muconic semialdehyde decarboxylase
MGICIPVNPLLTCIQIPVNLDGMLIEELAQAGPALAAAGLVTAFGHVSARTGDHLLITPPRPPGSIDPADPGIRKLALDARELPTGIPQDAWMHIAIANARPDVGAVCRAQPPSVTAAAAARIPLVPVHGQGALLGPEVPVHADSRLVREPALGEALAATLGSAFACVIRGNGAITVGRTVGEAVARMWILEETARITLAAGKAFALPADEQRAWAATGSELLERIWHYLKGLHSDA